jgi:hypothetical protein
LWEAGREAGPGDLGEKVVKVGGRTVQSPQGRSTEAAVDSVYKNSLVRIAPWIKKKERERERENVYKHVR